MPGFFQSLKRIVKGEPVYRPDEYDGPVAGSSRPESSDAPEAIGAKQASGYKLLPRVYIDEIKCEERGDRMECWAKIRNESEYEVFLDKIHVFGARRELDTNLRKDERREFLIFSDRRPTNAYNKVELQYRDLEGDYFVGMHDLEARKQGDGSYTIHRIKYIGLKDI
ncbi:hypothetical protein H7171_04255 [Candidatus Saccharibacteria bacterium]|nr:hypothetical protein [Candidatus Saccharibacteria bacterium]